MTDALTNAERLLREAAMNSDDLEGWHSERGEAYRAAADALAAERERRYAAPPLPPAKGMCDCGDPSAASCASCIVADYQAQHPSCTTCCPRPYLPTPEPSEAMVEAATRAKECLMTYAAGLSLDMDEAREVGHKLRAALAAQEGA